MSEPTPIHEEFDPALEGELTALADGRLDPDRRAALDARIASDPALAAALAEQQVAIRTITAAATSVEAPHDLRMRLAALVAQPRRRHRLLLPAGGALAAAGAAAAAVVLLTGGEDLTVRRTLSAASRPTQGPAALDPTNGRLLRERVEQVVFPNFGGKFGWTPHGTRSDRLDQRDTRTVIYTRGSNSISYTIVAGASLPIPSDATSTTVDGVALRSFTSGSRNVVTWQRQGHTCVLSGPGVPNAELSKLAAWKGQGAITF